jgi:HEAT repeat protein
MLRHKNGALEERLAGIAWKHGIAYVWLAPDEVLHEDASIGFEILGPEAKDAVPALCKIFEQNISPSSVSGAAVALVAIGPPSRAAIPTLLRSATNSAGLRFNAIFVLSSLRAAPEIVEPMLVNCLSDRNQGIRRAAAVALTKYGINPTNVRSGSEFQRVKQ